LASSGVSKSIHAIKIDRKAVSCYCLPVLFRALMSTSFDEPFLFGFERGLRGFALWSSFDVRRHSKCGGFILHCWFRGHLDGLLRGRDERLGKLLYTDKAFLPFFCQG